MTSLFPSPAPALPTSRSYDSHILPRNALAKSGTTCAQEVENSAPRAQAGTPIIEQQKSKSQRSSDGIMNGEGVETKNIARNSSLSESPSKPSRQLLGAQGRRASEGGYPSVFGATVSPSSPIDCDDEIRISGGMGRKRSMESMRNDDSMLEREGGDKVRDGANGTHIHRSDRNEHPAKRQRHPSDRSLDSPPENSLDGLYHAAASILDSQKESTSANMVRDSPLQRGEFEGRGLVSDRAGSGLATRRSGSGRTLVVDTGSSPSSTDSPRLRAPLRTAPISIQLANSPSVVMVGPSIRSGALNGSFPIHGGGYTPSNSRRESMVDMRPAKDAEYSFPNRAGPSSSFPSSLHQPSSRNRSFNSQPVVANHQLRNAEMSHDQSRRASLSLPIPPYRSAERNVLRSGEPESGSYFYQNRPTPMTASFRSPPLQQGSDGRVVYTREGISPMDLRTPGPTFGNRHGPLLSPHPSSSASQHYPSLQTNSHRSAPHHSSQSRLTTDPKAAFLSLFSTFYDSLTDSRILSNTLQEQIRRSDNLVASLENYFDDKFQSHLNLFEDRISRMEKGLCGFKSEKGLEERVRELEAALASSRRRSSDLSNAFGARRGEAVVLEEVEEDPAHARDARYAKRASLPLR